MNKLNRINWDEKLNNEYKQKLKEIEKLNYEYIRNPNFITKSIALNRANHNIF